MKSVYITTSTGGPQAALDVRVTDFRIRAEAFPDMPAAALIAAPEPVAAPVPAEEAPPAKSRLWLLAGLVVGVMLMIFVVIAVRAWLFMRHRHQAAETSAPSSLKGEQVKPEAVLSSVACQCSACGKRLKATPELAGKKVKCSQCGKTVLVPDTKVDEP